jgi:hypothetical protein
MHANRASPPLVPFQQRLDCSRYGWERSAAMPRSSASFTSQNVAWHAPQKSIESAASSFAGLTVAARPSSNRRCLIAST